MPAHRCNIGIEGLREAKGAGPESRAGSVATSNAFKGFGWSLNGKVTPAKACQSPTYQSFALNQLWRCLWPWSFKACAGQAGLIRM